MKTLKFLVAMIILLIPVCSYPASLDSMVVSLIDGDVQIKTADTSEWVPASINMPLMEGDNIWVPEGGRAEIRMPSGTAVRLDEGSSLEILTVEKDSAQFYLQEGRAYTNFKGMRDKLIQIDTPLSSVRTYDRSTFRIDVSPDGYTDISVLRGRVEAEDRNGTTKVAVGKTLSIGEDSYAEISPIGPADDWEMWNRERDRKIYRRGASSEYMPNELDAYSSDLDENGRWVNTPDYGYVWTPTVMVSAGWSPYSNGRWTWMGGDYVWISYDPWGWVPYHYGRWSFSVSIGWFWVPPVRGAVYWGPGFVGWVSTPTYVAWVPLAPGETYYGYGNYGPNSVNITNINIQRTTVNVYKNVNFKNSVTVVSHDTFVTGRHHDVQIKENPFLKEKIHIGRPEIKPERASYMPVVKDIPAAKQPPKAIREIRHKELKEKRPIAKGRDMSVFRPGSPRKSMPMKELREPKPKERRGLEREKHKEEKTQPKEKMIPPGREKQKEYREKEKPVQEEKEKQKEGRRFAPSKGKGTVTEEEKPEKQKEEKGAVIKRERQAQPSQKEEKPEGEVKQKQRRIERPSVVEKPAEKAPAPAEKKAEEKKKAKKKTKEEKAKEEKGKEEKTDDTQKPSEQRRMRE